MTRLPGLFVARFLGYFPRALQVMASIACLHQAMKRGNVCVEMGVPVARVLFNAQKRAIGVRV